MKYSLGFGALCAFALLGCGGQRSVTSPSEPEAGSSAGGAASTARAGAPSAGANNEGGAAGDAAFAEGGAAGASPECDAVDVGSISVFSSGAWDPLGYPPYAVDGCTLVYVAPDTGGGALHIRNLSSGEDSELDAPTSNPRRPSVAGDVIAWEVDDGGASQVRVRYGEKTKTLVGNFDHAAEPRAARDAVVFTAFLAAKGTADSDVYLYDVVQEELSAVAAGPGQQRFADVSPSHVAVTDFSEDPRGYFDETGSISDIVIVDRQSGVSTSRKAEGKQAFPLLGSGGAIVYLDWRAVHPEPKFSEFWLKAGYIGKAPALDFNLKSEQVHTDPAYVRPSLHGLNVDFVDTQSAQVGLYRATVGSTQAPVAVVLPRSARLLGPVAAARLTLIAEPLQGQGLSLIAIQR